MNEIYEAIRTLELTEQPDSVAADAIRPITKRDIVSADVRRYLREVELWFRTGPMAMGGAFQIALDSGQLPPPLVAALGELYSSVFGGSAETISSATRATIAAKLFLGWNALVQIGVATKEQCIGFYELGGGQPFLEITEAVVAQAKADYEKEQNRQLAAGELQVKFDQLWNEHAAAAIQTGEPATFAESLKLIASEFE